MGSFGQSLREARETRGVSLEDIAKATKIRTEYLVALETDDFERLPGSVFSRGFVRAYAEMVGLDPEAAVAASSAEHKARGTDAAERTADVLAELNRLIPHKAPPLERRSSPGLFLVGAGAIVVIGIVSLAIWWIAGDRAGQPTVRAVASAPAITAAAGREPHGAPVAHLPAPVPVAPPAVGQPTPPRTLGQPVPGTSAAPGLDETQVPLLTASPDVVAEPTRPPSAARESALSVSDSAVGRGVANRRIVDPGDSFDQGQAVWFWTRVEGAAAGERIRHVWLHAGQVVHTIDLELGGASWRTQSTKKLLRGSKGDWRVEARDSLGRVLAATEFVCR